MQGFWNLLGKAGDGPGKDFQYDVGEKASSSFDSKSIWTLHHGKKRVNADMVTVFICDAKVSSPEEIQLAKVAHKRLKTLRHPNIIKYLDGFESESLVYVVTEPVIPLCQFLDEEDGRNTNLITWGLYQVITGLSFLINSGNLMHENVNIFSVFVGLDGEWKLGGVEYMHAAGTAVVGKLPCLCRYDPPEGNSCDSKKVEKWSTDAWGLGCLIWEIYNGALQKAATLKVVNKIPKTLILHYCDLVHATPKKRTNPKTFLETCMQHGQFFNSDFIKANLFLNEIQIKDTAEQKEFFITLDKSLDSFPRPFCVHKVLPQLLNAFEFGAAGSAVLSPLFKVGRLLDDVAYQAKIVPCIIKLFSSNDRATRIQLLQQMEKFVMHLQPSVVDNQIFACVATGFGDTLPAMREQTIKAMLLLAPKLSAKTVNNQLLRYFAKLQMDEQPGIRTNTTICLGKIAQYIPHETRQKMLAPGFIRAMRDPFPHARNAGIMAMSATQKYYSKSDIATKLLPSLCLATIDQEKSVRDNAFRVIKGFISLLEKHSSDPENVENMPDSTKQGEQGSTWTGWAVSSFTSRFYQNPQGAATPPEKTAKTPENQQPNTEENVAIKNKETTSNKEDDAESDHSDYNDTFGDEYWGDKKEDDLSDGESDSGFAVVKNELLAVQTELKGISNQDAPRDAKSDNDSDSDYGDWGAGDNWGKENDEWGSHVSKSKPVKKKMDTFTDHCDKGKNGSESIDNLKSKPANKKADTDWGNGDDLWDSFGDSTSKPDNKPKPETFSQQPFSNVPPSKTKSASILFQDNSDAGFFDNPPPRLNVSTLPQVQNNPSPQIHDKPSPVLANNDVSGNAGEWGGNDWDEGGGWEVEEKTKEENAKEKRKQEMQRRRDEKKLKRELANKEKKTKSAGAMKLGAVKKNPMGDG